MTSTRELQVKCDYCGQWLDIRESLNGDWCVDPCTNCVDEARQEGYEAGWDAGYNEGYEDADRDAEERFRDFKTNG